MFIANLKIYKKLSKARSATFATVLAQLIPANSKMLDFGCGNMYTSTELLKHLPSLHITGVDVIRDQNLTDNILSDERILFKKASQIYIEFDDNTFDVVAALATLHHTHDPTYYMKELKRIVKPGGFIILIEEMYLSYLDKLYISAQDWVLNKLKKGVPVPLNFKSKKYYLETFSTLGLKIIVESFVRPFPTHMHHFVFKLQKN